MLITTPLPTLQAETVAEKMRAIASCMQCQSTITEQSVDEAMHVFHATGDVSAALNAGILFVRGVRPAPREHRYPDDLTPTWAESWPFIVGGLIVVALLLAGRVMGIVP